jgi:hypothetical protein
MVGSKNFGGIDREPHALHPGGEPELEFQPAFYDLQCSTTACMQIIMGAATASLKIAPR